ncbi:ABC transporter substrate-binding protein [Umezawaea sp. NPDC059074]|uniref:ABC transporter substrate-binding protein n=1 Tax=Umezawaea sp. NPDC059074 TaxID=3346716 RepID=UPI003697F920
MSRRTRPARAVQALGLVATFALVLAGCGTSESSSNTSLTGEVRMLANISPALTKQYYEGLVAPFVQAHPGVKVTIESPSGKDVQSTLQQELASGSTPDVVASNLDPVVAPQMAPFPDEQWVKDTPLAGSTAIDGNTWQVATGTQIQSVVFYNKDAFTKAGITAPPTSLADFTTALTKLKAAGYVPLQTAGEWVTGAQFAMAANPDLLGEDASWYLDRNAKKVKFADSAYSKYLDAYAGWIKDDLVPKDSLGEKYQDSIDNFVAGKSGMFIMGNWLVSTLDTAKPTFEAGAFPTPTLDGSAPKQLSGMAQPYSILKASKNQNLARELVKYLVSDQTAIAASLKSEGNFRKGVTYDGSPLTKEVAAILDKSPGAVNGTSGPGINSGFGNQLNTVVQSLYTGQSASQAAAELDTWWDANAVQ